ncbi:sodium channel protein Nach-like [Arctopsyche grandis]|uniref:sodium channel protein Nach-like n=1 Tax=Arctopsyche grandis TaxID=121162 RepID=UPI00406D8DB2
MKKLGYRVEVLIFNSGDYPDVYSGGCYEIPTAPRTEVYLSLDAVSITSTSAVESLAPSTRGCLFESDKKKFVDSFSDCMLSCRLRNMHTTCGCLPFFAPFQFIDDVCDLTAIMCLKRWEDNWAQAWSGEDLLLENGEVAGKGLQPPCFFCLPSCEEAMYRPHQYTIPLQPASVNSQPDMDKAKIKKGIVFVDHLVLHVFFSRDSVVHLVHGLLFNWYDLLSSLGGLCGLVLGGSIISVVEIFYYFFGGPATKFRRPRQTEMRQLYWEELRNYKRK